MGGVSKWNILRDEEMSGRMAQVFAAVPEVVGGVLGQRRSRPGGTGTRSPGT